MAVKNCFIRGSVVRYIQVSSKVRAAKDLQRATPSEHFRLLSLSLSLSPELPKQLPQDAIDTDLLHDATRREARNAA